MTRINQTKALTPELQAEAERLMGIGYSPGYAAWVVDVNPLQLCQAVTGYGGTQGLVALGKAVREMRTDRIKANIAAYPSTPMWSAQEVAA
jgi:hypothetical protein